MKNSITVVVAVIALVIGFASGYMIRPMPTDVGMTKDQVNDLIMMMSSEGEGMQKMGALMKDGGMMMQTKGVVYNDAEMMSMGKDMEAAGVSHMQSGTTMMEHGGPMMEMTGMNTH